MASLPPQNLTQPSGPLTCLSSDLGWVQQKYNHMEHILSGLHQGVLSLQDSLHYSTLRVLGVTSLPKFGPTCKFLRTHTAQEPNFNGSRVTQHVPPSKTLVVSTPRLLRNLHTISLAKTVPYGLKHCKCKKIAIPKHPPIPYISEKDCVQKTFLFFKNNHLKTQIGKGMELQVPIWHSGMHEAFLIHVGSALKAIKKKGYFKAHKAANMAYLEQCKLAKQAKTHLAKPDGTTSKVTGASKKSTKKPNKTAAVASPADPSLQAEYVSDIKQAQEAAEKAKAKGEQDATCQMLNSSIHSLTQKCC